MPSQDHQASQIVEHPALEVEELRNRNLRAQGSIRRALALRDAAPISQERELHNALAVLRGER